MSSPRPPSYCSLDSTSDQNEHQHQQPAFRQRKSATIVTIGSSDDILSNPASASGSRSTATSPTNSFSSLSLPINSTTSAETVPEPAIPRSMRPDLQSQRERKSSDSDFSLAEEGEATPLIGSDDDGSVAGKWYTGPLFVTGVKLAGLFMIFTAVLVATFYWGIPALDPEDKGVLKLPRSFEDLQNLNSLFQKYKGRYPYRILTCGVVAYLFVQTFSLPGSMYISILFGAAYGMVYGLLLSCLCESVGSIFCYTLSALLAPPLLALPFYRARVETWRVKIMGDPKKGKEVTWDGVAAFLIVLRIAPFPPHWVANFVAPHLGINPILFWATCFVGIAPVSVIHVTIGSSLDSMTSAADFHILSLRNVLGLGAVIVAVLIPVGLKKIFKQDLGELGEAEEVIEEQSPLDNEVDVLSVHTVYDGPVPVEVDEHGQVRRYQAVDSGVVLAGPSAGDPSLDIDNPHGQPRRAGRKGKGRALEIIADVNEDDETESDQYRPHDSQKQVNVKGKQASSGKANRLKGYGSIEPVEPVVRSEEAPSPVWYGFAR